ncbi:RNA recognition motif domain eukaryote [Penicillium cf. griseofulvum]|uniref:RNA recognition motif domain eukaryote n=1 Tax=Penicillium cf. griseofulvum TaxID=2972120 RepID=A0A9W9N0L3_9EURO|nr:RNA recognition motif domain eukaryote [Penicillium cf. griseofulvum]KAJ5422405.1 RNA recognition motif domain eukaryote [Penicillium cf. griseofulvum]KAJ5428587.1 RNA recognition motif domain eukaryote [Penicillium cf. griseofulvum]
MSGIDVEALLESTAAAPAPTTSEARDDHSRADTSEPHDRSRDRRRRRDHSRDRRPDRDLEGDEVMKSDAASANGSLRSRKRSISRESERRRPRRDRDGYRSSGDFYRGGGRARSRSRSPYDDRHYRPNRRQREEERRPRRDNDARRGSHGDARRGSLGGRKSPELTEDERDRRTIFVQQLAARLRTQDLFKFFAKAGPVKDAQIVKDRVSGRSKGVGYVEFKNEESVTAAIRLTGQMLLGIPIIAQLTEAEKNRQARNPEATAGNQHTAPFHRLYVGNVHFSITEDDLTNVFEPFGELEFVQLQKDETGRSKGYAFVQFANPEQARDALEKMNGFELAGRAIRVGLGNDKFTPDTHANRPSGASPTTFQGSSFSGQGGRGVQAGGSNNFDRAKAEKGGAGASALDDTDVAGVNFNNYSRDALMRKLARTDDPQPADDRQKFLRPKTETKPLPINVNMASRCVLLRNMFDPAEETGESWIKELEEDVRSECEEKYGHVVHISLDVSSQGDIYLKFDRVQGGENAIKGLNGRYFGGRQITAQPVVDAVYSSLFSRTKAI